MCFSPQVRKPSLRNNKIKKPQEINNKNTILHKRKETNAKGANPKQDETFAKEENSEELGRLHQRERKERETEEKQKRNT